MRTLIFLSSALLLAGCAGRHLVPAQSANRVEGMDRAARASEDGISVIVQSDNWKGNPQNLKAAILPMHVSVQNHSGHPVSIAYRRFALVTGNGMRLQAIPPFHVSGSVPTTTTTTVVNPWFGWERFDLAPYYAPYYGPAFATWGGPWYYDSPYYTAYTTWQQPLPTADMLAKALPEGVLHNGGQIDGYLYFHKITNRTDRVTFAATFLDPNTEQTVAVLDVPFVVKK